jgi:hypothetical protein
VNLAGRDPDRQVGISADCQMRRSRNQFPIHNIAGERRCSNRCQRWRTG